VFSLTQFILPIEITAIHLVAFSIKSCEQHYHSGLSDAFEVSSRKALYFRRGRLIHLPIPESNTNILQIKVIYWLSGVCGHSNKHTPWHIQEVQYAFKDLMIHEVCNSHYVSQFAAFFIVVGTKTSVAESRMAFASYARGILSVFHHCQHPHPLLFRLMFKN